MFKNLVVDGGGGLSMNSHILSYLTYPKNVVSPPI
jgi:hypothetical protein